jgi:hypothetical protein
MVTVLLAYEVEEWYMMIRRDPKLTTSNSTSFNSIKYFGKIHPAASWYIFIHQKQDFKITSYSIIMKISVQYLAWSAIRNLQFAITIPCHSITFLMFSAAVSGCLVFIIVYLLPTAIGPMPGGSVT